ncbi:MAG: S-layer homology domain-containing protein [Lawsonibacter sp.]|jgi:hypothetical protein
MRNLKRALSLGLTATMISGLMVMGSSAASYKDVSSENHQEAIEVLKEVGIMVGDENGSFNPEQKVTRNEMAVVMSNLMAYNVKTYANTSPFTDVPEWAEPYVAACYTNGITSGYTANTYGGSDNVTTAQAALMVMKALGYFQFQSDFESDWQLATVKQANKIDLFEDVETGVKEAMTRDELAQLVLNALESGTVEADDDTIKVDTGDVSVSAGKVKYNYITSNKDYAKAISDKAPTSSTSSTVGAIVELGEKLYNGDLTRDEDATDDFERPATQWEYQAKEIGTFAEKADYTFTAKVTSKKLYDAIGKTATEYEDWDLSVNGEGLLDYTGEDLYKYKSDDDADFYKKATNKAALTGNGAVTEVFVDGTDKTVDVVVINYYAAEVLKVDEDEGTITLNALYGDAKSDDEFETTEFAEDDIVIYSYANDEIQEVYAAEKLEGDVTRVRSNTKEGEETDGDNFVVDGTTYKYNMTMDSADRLVKENVNNDVVAYLDANGYVAYIDESAMTYDYAYVLSMGTESDQYGGGDKATVYARLILTDGTLIKVETDETSDKTLVNHIVSYSKDKDDVYSLDDRSGEAIFTGEKREDDDSSFGAYDKDTNKGLTIENGKAAVYVDGKNYTANANTVFVVVDTDDRYADYDITVYTGIKNVPDIDGDTATQAVVAVDKNKSNVAKVVYIEDADVSGAESVIFAHAKSNAKLVKDTEIGDYYEIDAVVDGKVVTLNVKASSNAKDVLVDDYDYDVIALKSITKNDDDLVVSVKAYETEENDADTFYVNTTGTLKEEKDTVGIGDATKGEDKSYGYSDDVAVVRYNYKEDFSVSRIGSIKNDLNDDVVAVLDENVLIGICILEEKGGEGENIAPEAVEKVEVTVTLGENVSSAKINGTEVKTTGKIEVAKGAKIAVTDVKCADGYEKDAITLSSETAVKGATIEITAKEIVEYGVHYWAGSNSGNICFAFWKADDQTAMSARDVKELGLKADDFTVTINGKKYVGQEIKEYGSQKLSDSLTTGYVKVSFGAQDEVLMAGDKYSTNDSDKANNNITFKAEISGVTVAGYEGTINAKAK